MKKDTVQLHVDVSRSLWKVMKVEAMNTRDTLSGVVVKTLENAFGSRLGKWGKALVSYELKQASDEAAPTKTSPTPVSAPVKGGVGESGKECK